MRNRFWIVLLLITLYGFLMTLLNPTGVSLTKIAITLLPWLSCSLAIIYFVKNYSFIKRKVSSSAWVLFTVLILLNFTNIIRGALAEGGVLTTVFGNPYNSLALLTPFAMCFSLAIRNLAIINRFFIYSTATGIVSSILALTIVSSDPDTYLRSALFLVSPAIFLIGALAYQNRINKVIIYIGTLLLFGYLGVLTGSRATVLRIFLLYLSNMVVVFYGNIINRRLLAIAMCTLLFPYFMIMASFDNGQSIFRTATQYLQSEFGSKRSENENVLTKGDTRTFLYQEVFTDLKRNGQLLFGKGSNGTYYSHFFHLSKKDSDTRLTVEVGILALLLKGGVVAVILNLSLFYLAIFLSFFRASNQYVMWVGFMLLVHVQVLFVENLVSYDLYNYSIWFFVGICLSKDIRRMSNMEILATFKRMPKFFPRVTW